MAILGRRRHFHHGADLPLVAAALHYDKPGLSRHAASLNGFPRHAASAASCLRGCELSGAPKQRRGCGARPVHDDANADVTSCVVRGISALTFPPPDGGDTSVVFPVLFSPGE
jgi:hypothetical protein